MFDIVIVGGGMVGGSLALALKHLPLKILVIDKAEALTTIQEVDNRAIAVNKQSMHFYEQINILSKLEARAYPIKKIHISKKGMLGRLQLNASDFKTSKLGLVISADYLNYTLQQSIDNIAYETALKDFKWCDNYWKLSLVKNNKEEEISTKLLIGADGSDSFIRRQLNIEVQSHDYGQKAMISHVELINPHQDIAYEIFLESGNIALLPISPKEYKCIWITRVSDANQLELLSNIDYGLALQKVLRKRFGIIRVKNKRYTYPLQMKVAERFYNQQLLLIGNAAVSLHPIAAQGLNLALKDIALVSSLIQELVQLNKPLEDIAWLQRYAEKSFSYHHLIQTGTHQIHQWFATENHTKKLLTQIALPFFDNMPFIKQTIFKWGSGARLF
ncbi:MAG: 2-polyprenyl-6-methoxyphenol 4-hydroxylase [Francisellaceae bacterium]|nr:2-polyprenyl-6-methoxyphenol 4-hydroxylase [Francisellaceae bacterium]